MNRLYLLVIALVLFLGFTMAITVEQDFDDRHNVIVKEYSNNVSFDLIIENAIPGRYNVYTLSDVYIQPSDIFTLTNRSNYEDTYEIIPMKRLLDVNGSYIVKYYLNHRGVRKYPFEIPLKIVSLTEIVTVESEVVDIRSDEVEIVIRNLYDVEISNLTARFSSVLFDSEVDFNLPARDEVRFKIPISNEDLKKTRAGSYLMDVVFYTPAGEVSTFGSIYLMEKEDVVTSQDTDGLFIQTTTVSKINTGNTVEDVRIEIERNIFSRLFTSVSLEPLQTVRDGSSVVYIWTKKITPSEVYSVKVKTNYWYPILIFVLLYILFVVVKRMMVSKIMVRKVVSSVKTANGEFALRVRIIVRAKTNLSDVSVVDRVPRTVKIYKKFGLSMPDEIDAVNRRLKWDAGDMRPGEERVYSYVVYSRVGFLGKFVLPPSLVRFKYNERYKKVESNTAFFFAGGEE